MIRFFIGVLLFGVAFGDTYRKQLAGPPSDFPNLQIPKPDSLASFTDSFSIQVDLSQNVSKYGHCWNTSYPIEDGNFTISIISPWASNIAIIMTSPSGKNVHLNPKNGYSDHLPTWGTFGFDGLSVDSISYSLNGLVAGVYNLELCSSKKRNPNGVDAMLAVTSHSEQKLRSHVTTFDLQEDRTVGVQIFMFNETSWLDKNMRPAVSLVDYKATLEITMPNGVTAKIPFYDDGLHMDLEAQDGVYGATLEANQIGYYQTKTTVSGVHPNGVSFIRSSNQIFPISSPDLTLTGLAELDKSDGRLTFRVYVDQLSLKANKNYYGRAQVWGTRSEIVDNYYPVAWIAGLVLVNQNSSTPYLELTMDPRWVHMAQVGHPFQLREVVVQDPDTNILISHRDEIFVDCQLNKQDAIFFGSSDVVIDELMTMGPRPTKYQQTNETGKLVLVHGYCSHSVWPLSDFSGAVEFQDFEESRSNDQFAQLILQLCDQYPSCSIIAHSQGGLASLHLKAFYWSGLDKLSGGRAIQTVGSPYQGCSLAGVLAGIGKVFGYGCGTQYDLTPEGASLWLSSIPMEARDHVYYYTTEYEKNNVFDSCVTAANLFLYSPNDGTCEKKFAELEGAHFMGNTDGWCHVGDMKYPPQCTDQSRNSEMNKLAGR